MERLRAKAPPAPSPLPAEYSRLTSWLIAIVAVLSMGMLALSYNSTVADFRRAEETTLKELVRLNRVVMERIVWEIRSIESRLQHAIEKAQDDPEEGAIARVLAREAGRAEGDMAILAIDRDGEIVTKAGSVPLADNLNAARSMIAEIGKGTRQETVLGPFPASGGPRAVWLVVSRGGVTRAGRSPFAALIG
ncbi:MAG: hypothetical protein FJX47_18925, partial [Alphaproteobacteria bacterium]|nr:hypothetical protein [Alphaproteobacteria bacterium]